jgi:hypothetical protein
MDRGPWIVGGACVRITRTVAWSMLDAGGMFLAAGVVGLSAGGMSGKLVVWPSGH